MTDGGWTLIDPADVGWDATKLAQVTTHAREHATTSHVILHAGRLLVEECWPPTGRVLGCELLDDGRTREDVASVQKSITSLLVAIALQRGLLELDGPVSSYVGPGWTRADAVEESRVTVRHLLTMTSGLTDQLHVAHAPGTTWRYTLSAAYHTLKRVLVAVAGEDLSELSSKWLFEPLGMMETDWVARPLPRVLDDAVRPLVSYRDGTSFHGLVTSARDLARLGVALLAGTWCGAVGEDTVARTYFAEAIQSSTPLNPAYGMLWWLNGKAWQLTPRGPDRVNGWLVPDAPADLFAALGALGRSLHIVPSLDLVVVRIGADPGGNPLASSRFGQELWTRLRAAGPGWAAQT